MMAFVIVTGVCETAGGHTLVTLTLSNVAVSRKPLLREQTARPTSSVLFMVMVCELITVQFVPFVETEPMKTLPVRFNFIHCGSVPPRFVEPVLVPLPPVEVR